MHHAARNSQPCLTLLAHPPPDRTRSYPLQSPRLAACNTEETVHGSAAPPLRSARRPFLLHAFSPHFCIPADLPPQPGPYVPLPDGLSTPPRPTLPGPGIGIDLQQPQPSTGTGGHRLTPSIGSISRNRSVIERMRSLEQQVNSLQVRPNVLAAVLALWRAFAVCFVAASRPEVQTCRAPRLLVQCTSRVIMLQDHQ